MFGTRQKNLAQPLRGAPPVLIPCSPTLLLGLPESTVHYLKEVLINDLVYSSSSKYQGFSDTIRLEILSNLDGESLVNMTKEYGGTVILSDADLYGTTGEVDEGQLENLKKESFQAVVVDDSSFIRDPSVNSFVSSLYHNGVSVVVVAIEGIFDLSCLRAAFQVDWHLSAYTTRSVRLNDVGNAIVGKNALEGTTYLKANFVIGNTPLLEEVVDPRDYLGEEDGIPDPTPGSPVVTKFEHDKSASYFGFVNPLDVSYGAIMVRLCYAAQHNAAAISSPTSEEMR